MQPRRWVWILLFVVAVVLLAMLETSWTVVFVRHSTPVSMWPFLLLGSLGFLGALGAVILLFIRLLREMSYSQLHREFLAQVSHELKTPLATLELSSQLLRRGTEVEPQQRERLWQAHDRELQRLRTEVETLLAGARLEQGLTHKKFWAAEARADLDLADWMRRSMPTWQGILGEAAELALELPDVPILVWTNEKLLELIVRNLLDNARKFAGVGQFPRVHLSVIPESEGDLRLEVRDAGVGFDPKAAKAIFKKFMRLRPHDGATVSGTGLGLYFVRQAARALEMRITAESRGSGQGATFRLTIPRRLRRGNS